TTAYGLRRRHRHWRRPRAADCVESGNRTETQHHRLAGGLRHGRWGGSDEIPLSVDLSGGSVAARRHDLIYLLQLRPPLHGQWHQLGNDFARSHAQRPVEDWSVWWSHYRGQFGRRDLLHDLRVSRISARARRLLGGL